jgi:hypothetical protein
MLIWSFLFCQQEIWNSTVIKQELELEDGIMIQEHGVCSER